MEPTLNILKLSDFVQPLPDFINEPHHIKILNAAPDRQQQLKKQFIHLNAQPHIVLFQAHDSALTLSLALQLYPTARFLVYQQDEKPFWLDIHHQQHYPVIQNQVTPLHDESNTNLQLVDDNIVEEKVAVTEITTQQNNTTLLQDNIDPHTIQQPIDDVLLPISSSEFSQQQDHQLLNALFKYSVWGLDQQENIDKVKAILHEVSRREITNKGLTKRALQKQKQAQRAYNLGLEVQQQFRTLSPSAFDTWFAQLLVDHPAQTIQKHLIIMRTKAQAWQDKNKARFSRKEECTVQSPEISRTQAHPNSLRHLAPASRWEILIDETGKHHENIVALNLSDSQLGRYVALAIPQGVDLPALSVKFHATDESPAVMDQVIQTILDRPVGVLGISAKDHLVQRSPRWFSSIESLINLVLHLLPLPESTENTVNILIEERGIFTNSVSLYPLQQLISTQLESLYPERFKQLTLNLSFIQKEQHPANGYVDALAHCWGGPSSQQRLKQAKFKGHCFLLADQEVIERIYSALDAKIPLKPAEWYQLITHIEQEPEHSLLHYYLAELGQDCQKNMSLWYSYLNEVNLHLTQKNYHAPTLYYTLNWLKTYQPEQAKFPPRLQLEWVTAQIAADNHLGRMNEDLVAQALQLGAKLHDEYAPLVAQLYLRIAVAATNIFEFEHAQAILNHAEQPLAVMGRLNYAKWLSSQGQIAAFTSQPQQAQYYFKQAIAEFSKLADKKEADKNAAQTHIYQLIHQLDHLQANASVLDNIEQYFQQYEHKSLDKIIDRLSKSTERRFEHHLLLRSMIIDPQFEDIKQRYLATYDQWKSDDGHPWMLINFWRAWLLHHAGKQQEAKTVLAWALAAPENEENVTLQWIRLVITTVAIGLNLNHPVDVLSKQQQLQQYLPEAPHQAWHNLVNTDIQNHKALLDAIAQCLPFNFK